MTQLFNEEGIVSPVTAIVLEPLKVSSIKNMESDGYEAVQVEYGGKNKKRKEFRGITEGYEIGKDISVIDIFTEGDAITLAAKSKGKGFAGVVKRYGFAGGPRTHGQKHDERGGGAIGAGLRARVPKGQKMPGRMGGERVTVKGTKVVSVDKEQNLLLVHGSIPGRCGTIIEIQGI